MEAISSLRRKRRRMMMTRIMTTVMMARPRQRPRPRQRQRLTVMARPPLRPRLRLRPRLMMITTTKHHTQVVCNPTWPVLFTQGLPPRWGPEECLTLHSYQLGDILLHGPSRELSVAKFNLRCAGLARSFDLKSATFGRLSDPGDSTIVLKKWARL